MPTLMAIWPTVATVYHGGRSGRLVAQDGHAGTECDGVGELELARFVVPGEEPPSAAQDEGEDPQPEVVDEMVIQQCVEQLVAPIQQDVLTRLLLEFGHLGDHVSPDDLGVVPLKVVVAEG